MSIIQLYVTWPDVTSAEICEEALLMQKLVACSSIVTNARSRYVWEGNIKTREEVIMIAKTSRNSMQQAIDAITAHHPDTCPCITAFDIVAGHEDYIAWVSNTLQS